MEKFFTHDERIGILIPNFQQTLELYDLETQYAILYRWEQIRGAIPERISKLEAEINEKQARLNAEVNLQKSNQLNWQIAELASIIIDLHIWYRFHSDHLHHPVKMDT